MLTSILFPSRPDESLCVSRDLDAQKCAVKFQQDLAFRMLECGRSDLLPEALALMGKDKIDTRNEQVSQICVRHAMSQINIPYDNLVVTIEYWIMFICVSIIVSTCPIILWRFFLTVSACFLHVSGVFTINVCMYERR